MTPHDFRRIALAHELLARAPGTNAPSTAVGADPHPDGARQPAVRAPAIAAAREAAG